MRRNIRLDLVFDKTERIVFMSYRRNQWVYKAIENCDVIKLQEFANRLKDISLLEALDRRCIKLIAKLPEEELVILEKEFSGILKIIPFSEVLVSGNTYLLALNEELYFQGDWEKTVKKLLFLNYKRAVDILELIKSKEGLEKIIIVLEWILEHKEKLPPIDGILELCSKVDIKIGSEWKPLIRKKKDREQILLQIKKIRLLTGEKRIVLSDFTTEDIKNLNFQEYEGVILNMSEEFKYEYGMEQKIIELIKKCDVSKLEIKNIENLHNKDLLQALLQEVEYVEESQEKLYRLYERFDDTEKLYNGIDEKLIYTGAYTRILELYFQKVEEQDEVIGVERNEKI